MSAPDDVVALLRARVTLLGEAVRGDIAAHKSRLDALDQRVAALEGARGRPATAASTCIACPCPSGSILSDCPVHGRAAREVASPLPSVEEVIAASAVYFLGTPDGGSVATERRIAFVDLVTRLHAVATDPAMAREIVEHYKGETRRAEAERDALRAEVTAARAQVNEWRERGESLRAEVAALKAATNVASASGPWTTLEDLAPGSLFETRDGIRAVKSEYHYTNENPQPQCVLLASGEYAHFVKEEKTEVRELIVTGAAPAPAREVALEELLSPGTVVTRRDVVVPAND